MKFWNQYFTTNITRSFLLLSLVSVGVVGGVAFFKAREALKQAAFNRLNVTATLKEEEITRWFEDQQRDFLLVTKLPDVKSNVNKLLSQTKSDPDYQAAYKVLSEYLLKVNRLKPSLKEIFILDRSNRVILSINKVHEGRYEPLGNVTYVEKIELGDSFAPIFYVSPITGKPSVTLATPLRDVTGKHKGIILAHLNLDRIDHIVRERTGLGKSGETYLVGSMVTRNTFISKENDNRQEFAEGVSSQGIDAAMSGVSGYGLYFNYAKVPVIGVYRWLNDQDLALLVEMHQEEAFAPARQLAGTIVAVGLVSVIFLIIGVNWLTQQLKISREQLENYSHKLEMKAQEAEAANRSKSEFLANMSHELRTPLNAILGFAQLMERDPALTPKQCEFLATINRSGKHLLGLINDVLEMSKIEAGRVALKPVPFNLRTFLQTLQEMFLVRTEAKQLSLQFELAPDLPEFIVTDEGKLRQIIINLLGNAVKFTSAGGVTLRATIGTRDWGLGTLEEDTGNNSPPLPPSPPLPFLFFEVEDTGCGIAPEEMKDLFKPFVQTSSGVQIKEGTGLGLAISHQFVQLMGGELCCNSTFGQGTIFRFDVQVQIAKLPEEVAQTTQRRVLKLANNEPAYRILVVDDHQENRELLVQLLQSVGFDTCSASDGQEAVTIWQQWHPHLIWMDMRMPLMDGYQSTKQIKAMERNQQDGDNLPAVSSSRTIIIALTASAFEEQRANILTVGCDDFVRKPFQEQIIFEKIAKHLGVKYIYTQQQESKQTQVYNSNFRLENKLKSDDLIVMPPSWREQMCQAALEVDADKIVQLIELIPKTHSALADKLTKLVRNFCFDEILELTQGECE
ncbi:MAG: response regulator [Chlorogloeopsis fritschii C42_A2020_084]|uniref:hybrid sensor histidine kinase/response regulator n=1 Tax=Chlorogloeopsis fritschii TaxID=1124 RepID=UPI001A03B102|nr:histidine kinase dimerization/phospho-acceptor domain-containing protein [Chlorogloeopsis fritschii]MBF2008664.1 response regulator [Chlorogloeopsis fritschii C42_A2020_084]